MHQLFKLANKLAAKLDPKIVVEEHKDVHPVSYMAQSNLENIHQDTQELLSLLNDKDDLPQWVDEELALAKDKIRKALGYIRSQKTKS